MIKNIFFITGILFFLFPITNYAQNKSVKINAHAGYDPNTKDGWIGRLAPLLIIENQNKGLHQIEWTTFDLSREDYLDFDGIVVHEGAITNQIDLAWRYQYSHALSKKSEKVIPYLGFSGTFGIFQSLRNPYVANEFRTAFHTVYTRYGIVPAIRFQSEKRFFIDVEIPVEFLEISYDWNRTGNPSLPIRQRRTETFNLDAGLNPLQIRIGLGVHL